MKHFFIVLFLISSITVSLSAEEPKVHVAKIDYRKIKNLLEEVVLAKTENKMLSSRYKAMKDKARANQKKMQLALMKGEKINPMEAAASAMSNRKDKKSVEVLCERYLLLEIEKSFAGKYEIILKSDYNSPLLYTKIAIDDVTDIIRQKLLKALPVSDEK